MKKLLLILTLFILKTGFSQTDTAYRQTSVIVHKDPRVEALVKKQSAINTASKKNTARTMRGYRLMVLSTNKRDEAIAAKTKIYTYYPELQSYLNYQSPFFKLKAGNFKTRDEAEKYKKLMNTMFPKGVFIVGDIIEVKPEKDEDQID